VARRPLEREGIYLDGGRRTTQLMRDSLGGVQQPPSTGTRAQTKTIVGAAFLRTAHLVHQAHFSSPAVQGDHPAQRTHAPPPNQRVKLAWPVE
jgi:hypothetical protein